MYYVSKRMEVAGSHSLKLSYESKCQNLHGHNWIITVYCKAKKLNKDGMVCDFKHIKEKIHGKLDHSNLNGNMSVAHFTGLFEKNPELKREFYKLIDLQT